MRLSTWLSASAVALTMPSAAIAAEGPVYTYTPPVHTIARPPEPKPLMTWQYNKKPVTFHYNVTTASDTNWIGVFYSFGGAPTNGAKAMDPLTWEYAKGKEGEVRLNASKLAQGSYKAILMANDTYEEIVPPVNFHTGDKRDVRYYTYKMNLRPARIGEYWSFDASRMTNIEGDDENLYYLVYSSGDGWVHSTHNGILYGTPTKKSRRKTELAVKVMGRNKLSYFMEAVVEVRGPDEPMVKELKIMSMNLWYGGTQVDDYHAKQVKIINRLNADIVGLQETDGIHALRLAHALGWWAYETWDASIISRYPIVEALDSTNKSAAVRIALDGDKQQVVVWGAHLAFQQYGPYGFCFEGKDNQTVMQQEDDSGRTAEAQELSDAIKPYLNGSDTVPVLLTGDFNSPSHLDYTEATKDLHCGAGEVRWPSSWYPVQAGMKDSFREAHPDPVADPGYTWSPIFLQNPDYDNKPEPKDRIDFVYYAGAMKVKESITYIVDDPPPKPEPKQKDNFWTSDHYAVVTTFEMLDKALGKS